MDIANIVNAISAGQVRITDHADEKALADHLIYEEIYFSVIHGEVIEDYPIDTPYPSYLIFVGISQENQFIVFGPIIQITYGQF